VRGGKEMSGQAVTGLVNLNLKCVAVPRRIVAGELSPSAARERC
jgi:hypothetical protein